MAWLVSTVFCLEELARDVTIGALAGDCAKGGLKSLQSHDDLEVSLSQFRGSTIRNVEPLFSSLSTVIVPLICSRCFFTMLSPSPMPPREWVVDVLWACMKGSKILVKC